MRAGRRYPGIIRSGQWPPMLFKKQVDSSISVNRDLTSLALLRLLTAASVFWIALQLCQNALRATYLMRAIVWITSAYAAYGLIALATFQSENTVSRGFVTSTFINHNHFATYAGMGLVAACGLIFRIYQREVTLVDGSLQFKIASIIETTGQKAALLLGAGSYFCCAPPHGLAGWHLRQRHGHFCFGCSEFCPSQARRP